MVAQASRVPFEHRSWAAQASKVPLRAPSRVTPTQNLRRRVPSGRSDAKFAALGARRGSRVYSNVSFEREDVVQGLEDRELGWLGELGHGSAQ